MKTATRRFSAFWVILAAAGAFLAAGCTEERAKGDPEIKFVALRADVATMTMPDGRELTVWGFAEETAGPFSGQVQVPGPEIHILPDTKRLTIRLRNNLTEARTGWQGGVPVSIVVPGLPGKLEPVRWGLEETPEFEGRVRSLTTETPPDGQTVVEYTWEAVKPGSFIYQSGTHMQVQVQMGLYGAVVKDAGRSVIYDGTRYEQEMVLVYHEMDADLHDAVANGAYGPGKAMTSTVHYRPEYYLINGASAGKGRLGFGPIKHESATLIHFVNAGLELHSPLLYGERMRVIAEDGQTYPFSRWHTSVPLGPGKTKDVLVVLHDFGSYPLYDGALALTDGGTAEGGMLAELVCR